MDGKLPISDTGANIRQGSSTDRIKSSRKTIDPITSREELAKALSRVAKGEVDINKVRAKLEETVGKENIDAVADMYALAYENSGLDADAIWEECICDSLGDMNVFSDFADIDQGIITMVLGDIKQATEDTKTTPNKTRGAPDGKASRDIKKKKGKIAKYLPESKVGKTNMEYIRHQLTDLYIGVYDGIADGIAIENENMVYIVDSGKQDGKITFGVRRKRSIKNPQLRQDFIRSTNDESISKGHVSDELSARVRNGIGSNFGRNLRRKLGEELQVDTGKSPNNQNGISQKNGDNRGLGKTSRELDADYLSAVERGDMETALSKVAKGEDRAIVESYKANVNLIKGETARLESLRKEIDEIKYKKSITSEGRELSVKEFEQIAYTRAEEMGIEAERVKFKALKESGKYIATVDGSDPEKASYQAKTMYLNNYIKFVENKTYLDIADKYEELSYLIKKEEPKVETA